MGKLHELLAVEGDLQGASKKILEETETTFSKRADHFQGSVKTLTLFDEVKNEQEGGVTERKELVTTVGDKLRYAFGSIEKYYDAVLQKELTNQKTSSDLIINGEVIAKNLPATFLLGLETKLKQLRAIFMAIPTLQPGVSWVADVDAGEGVYKSQHPQVTYRTEKTIHHKVVYEATKEHPAQVHAWNEDIKVGKYMKADVSGMLSVAEKSNRLSRVDTLLRAVKKARQRANNIDVVHAEIGKKITDYIMG
jgi:hypothetical protein